MKRVLYVLGVLEDEDVDWLVSAGNRQELRPNDVLIQEGHPCDAIFLVLDGCLEVMVSAIEPQSIAQLVSGEVVGEMSFVDGQPPSATVRAKTTTIVLAIPGEALQHKLKQDIWFASRFYRAMAILLSSRLRSTVKHLQGEHWRPVAVMSNQTQADIGDVISVGGIRFDWMLKRLRDISSNPWDDMDGDVAD